jgi:2,3-bisphosphoglycerate-independent phosphoglycerate mutase
MSAPQITEKAIESIESGKYDFILINYANADMVGHTGIKEACVEAVKSVDKSLSFLIPAVLKAGGCLLITADHGNIEDIIDPKTGKMETEHSSNPVPCWLVTSTNHLPQERGLQNITAAESEIGGLLSDVAPTILSLMEIPKPPEMTGESLLPILK